MGFLFENGTAWGGVSTRGPLAAFERGEVLPDGEGRCDRAMWCPDMGVFKKVQVGADGAVGELPFTARFVIARFCAAGEIGGSGGGTVPGAPSWSVFTQSMPDWGVGGRPAW